MRLIEVTDQYRRDAHGVFECEKCGSHKNLYFYDDRNYHDKVIPAIKCENCGESTNSLGNAVDHTQTKYPEGMQV